MKILGYDGGYFANKAVWASGKATYPSVVGTANVSAFQTQATDDILVALNGEQYFVGNAAVSQSRTLLRPEDRDWYVSEEYYVLFMVALSKVHKMYNDRIRVVTGLPVRWLVSDRATLENVLLGEHKATVNDVIMKCNVIHAHILPQPFGTAFSQVLNTNGEFKDPETRRKNDELVHSCARDDGRCGNRGRRFSGL